MTTQIDPTKSYKTYYTKTYLDGIDPAIYPFLVTKGYSNGSETIVAGEYLDGVLLVANQTEPDVVIDAAGDPVCFWGLNGCGGVTPAINLEDANGNITVLNGNGNIPTDCTLRVSGGVLSQPLNETVSQSLTVGNFVIAPTPASGDVIVPTQTISITNPSNCRSMSWIFVCPGVDMSISGPDTKGGYLGIQSQLSINGGAFTQTTDTTVVTNNSSPVGYSGHDSNTNGHTAVGVLAPGGTVTVGIRVQFIKGIATGTYTSLGIQGFNMAILGSVI